MRIVLSIMATLLLSAQASGGEGVRVLSGMEFEARTDSAAQTDYVQLSLDQFTLRSGTVITCADLRLKVPGAAGKEIELWPAHPSSDRPWAAEDLREVWKLRRMGFVSEEAGDEGFVRFDLTDLLHGWSVETQGVPQFYLRLLSGDEMHDLAPRAVVSGELVLHTIQPRTR